MNNKSIYVLGMLGCLAAFHLQAAQPAGEESSAPAGKAISLTTGTGFELGISASHYDYHEDTASLPDAMHLSGQRFDLLLDGHMTFNSDYFFAAMLKVGSARLDFDSSRRGTATDIKDRVSDIRFLVGKDFLSDADAQYRPFSISPYIGLGSRNFYDDGRNVTSTGWSGYRRDTQYIYMPIGTYIRFRVANDARITTMLEYDQLLRGWQKLYLSDSVGSGLTDVTERQRKGYGLRGSIAFENQHWSFGPVFESWTIGKSEDDDTYAYKPNNHTSEYGLKAAYRF